jgi:hypothetical protein
MSNVNDGNEDYGTDTTVDPGPWLILATTLFCVLSILLFPCLVNFGRRYEKYRAPFDEDIPAAPTQDSEEEENDDECKGDEVSVDEELGVRIMAPSVEEQCSNSKDEGSSSYTPSYRSDDIDSSIPQSKESTKSTYSFDRKPIHALFDRLLVPPYPDDDRIDDS